MRNALRALSVLFSLGFAVVAGCTYADVAPSLPSAARNQMAVGQALFAQKCAQCHGASGYGGQAPPIVGRGAFSIDPPANAKLRNVQFHTAADVFIWMKANMPANAPGSLSDEEYAAILAYDLKANRIEFPDKVIDMGIASTIVIKP